MTPLGRMCGLAVLLSFAACAGESGEHVEVLRQAGALSEGESATALGVRILSVTPNGSGCPNGTSHVEIAPDGSQVDVRFDKYEAKVTPETTADIKDCVMAIELSAPPNVSYAIQSAAFRGKLALGEGVVGTMTSRYSIQGTGPVEKPLRTDQTGPLEDTYLYTDRLQDPDLTWTPCGLKRDINLTTRLVLSNSKPGRTGSISLTEAQTLQIVAKRCGTQPQVDGGSIDAGVDAGPGTAVDGGIDAPDAQVEPPPTITLPDGLTLTSLKPNGTGCPGDANVHIAPDGKSFSLGFSSFGVAVDSATMVSVKDCQLDMALKVAEGMSYAVSEYAFDGDAALEEGVSLRSQTTAYFSGAPNEAGTAQSDLIGHYDDSILIQDSVKEGSLVWSRCSGDRNLQLRATLRLSNTTPRKLGRAALQRLVDLKFAFRKCAS